MVRARLKALLIIFAIPPLAILLRLAWLQLVPGHHREFLRQSEHQEAESRAGVPSLVYLATPKVTSGNMSSPASFFRTASIVPDIVNVTGHSRTNDSGPVIFISR